MTREAEKRFKFSNVSYFSEKEGQRLFFVASIQDSNISRSDYKHSLISVLILLEIFAYLLFYSRRFGAFDFFGSILHC